VKPKIALLADVRNWAWARKAEQLKLHLSDQFALEIACLYARPRPDPLPRGADLYNTFEVFQTLQLAPGLPYVTGMTAHVWRTWEEKYGAGTVRRWAKSALAFHANSRLLENEMSALLERPIVYVPNGVDDAFFRRSRTRSRSGRLIVGWVGKPNPRKGSDIVREACALLGDRVELRTVERTHRNALGPDEMREFYQDLHVLCVASDMDGTPNPALEAASCGVAIVSNRIGNMPEFISDGVNGRLVERTAESIAAALRELTPAAAILMGDAARLTVEREWAWRHQAPAYGRMWIDALNARGKEAA
jgi:glycosyltransferase involved in cell wall biosynthesis